MPKPRRSNRQAHGSRLRLPPRVARSTRRIKNPAASEKEETGNTPGTLPAPGKPRAAALCVHAKVTAREAGTKYENIERRFRPQGAGPNLDAKDYERPLRRQQATSASPAATAASAAQKRAFTSRAST